MLLYISEYEILIQVLKFIQNNEEVEKNLSLGAFEVCNKVSNMKYVRDKESNFKMVNLKFKNKRDIQQTIVVLNRILEKETIELNMDKITIDFTLTKILLGLYEMLPSSRV